MAKKRKRGLAPSVLAQPSPPVLQDTSDAEWSEETRKRRMITPVKAKQASPKGIVAQQGPSKFAGDADVLGVDDSEERRVARHIIQNFQNVYLKE